MNKSRNKVLLKSSLVYVRLRQEDLKFKVSPGNCITPSHMPLSNFGANAGLELLVLPECWDYRRESTCLAICLENIPFRIHILFSSSFSKTDF